jgi:cytochrome d ubiquinol oxidase subunit II
MQGFWFGVIGVLWAGFFLLEGFDFGVGMLLPVVTKTDTDRKVPLRSIGPFWDGNEVWLIVAGGATFAAFPEWYASVFAGFYLAFAVLLVGLILRGIGIEYRGKAHTDHGRRWCDFAIVIGSLLPALLLGVAFADFIRGVRMNAAHDMTGGFWDLVTPYALLGGVVTLTLFAFHGAAFLVLRTEGAVHERARGVTRMLAVPTAVAAVAFIVWTSQVRGEWVSFVLGGVIVVAFLVAARAAYAERSVAAFSGSSVAVALVPVWVFAALWPYVLPARNNAAFSLTVYNANSSPYTLRVMMVVALIFTPIVLVYQAWTYWVFRARVTGADVAGDGYGGGIVARARESAKETLGGPSEPADSAAPKTP